MEKRCLRFQDISISEKMLYSLFLMTIGIGYLFALTHMYYTHQMRDGQPGMSIQDVMIAYYGSQDQTRLGSAINGGPMEPNLKSADEKEKILAWLNTDKSKTTFEQIISPILAKDCTYCHNPDINPGLPNLTTYEGVMEVASAKAASIPGLVKVSHIHLFGIAFILLFVGRIFIYCRMNITLKRIIVVIPFLSMLIDTLSWFVTRNHPSFAYVVVASGAMMGLSMGAQILISLYQMWVETFHPKFYLSTEQLDLLNKTITTLQKLGLRAITNGKAYFLKLAPIFWQSFTVLARQIGLSAFHASQYFLTPKLALSESDQLKSTQYMQLLNNAGYPVFFAGNGWLVKEAVFTWQFIGTLDDLEGYLERLPAKQLVPLG